MANVPVVAAAATVTDAGAVRVGEALFVSVTTAPPAGAACETDTVQVVLPFDVSDVCVQEKPVRVDWVCSDTLAVAVVPLSVPVRVATWLDDTVPVEIVKVPLVAPAATVTDAGTVRVGEALFVRATTRPPAGAACEIVAVHVVLPFDVSDVCVHEKPAIVTWVCSDTVAVAVVPLYVPVRVAVWLDDTVPVEIVNVPLVAPAATVTDAGTVRVGEALFVNVTTAPPAGAACDRITEQAVLAFEFSVVKVQENPAIVAWVCSETLAVAVVPLSVPVRVAD